MIEMNMAYHYPSQYWKTACLSINSGLEGELEKGTDYGTVSKAVNSMSDSIELPDINKSKMEFIPTEDEKIMFGLKPIAGLGTDAIDKIIANIIMIVEIKIFLFILKDLINIHFTNINI